MATYTDIEITVTITNGTCNIESGRYPLKTPLHIQIQPNKLYGIVNANKPPRLAYRYKSTGNAAFSESFKVSSTADVWELDTELQYYYAETEAMYCTVTYEYERRYAEIKNNLVRCSTSLPDGVYSFTEQTIKLTADNNCEFHVIPKISYYAYDESVIPWEWKYWDYEFDRVSESEYTYTFTPNSKNRIYTVSAEAVNKTDVTDKYGLIAAYKPDKETLVKLSKIRFATPKLNTVNVSGVNAAIAFYADEYIDTAKYMVSLRKFYIQIETTIRESISLGPYQTDIECDVIGTDIIDINMGTIAIAGRYQNNMDYKNTEMQIYLPFIGFEDISPSDFMDKAITLRYEINIINGDGLAILYADNAVMKIYSCNVSYPVPYRLNDRDTVNNQLDANTNYLLSEKPFIYVKSYKAAVPDAEAPYNDTKFYAKFSDVTGYTQATEIDFEVVHDYITKTEIDEIIRLLETGVFL